jgi:hypothetical protein
VSGALGSTPGFEATPLGGGVEGLSALMAGSSGLKKLYSKSESIQTELHGLKPFGAQVSPLLGRIVESSMTCSGIVLRTLASYALVKVSAALR